MSSWKFFLYIRVELKVSNKVRVIHIECLKTTAIMKKLEVLETSEPLTQFPSVSSERWLNGNKILENQLHKSNPSIENFLVKGSSNVENIFIF